MKKRIIAVMLAAVLAVIPTGNILADEILSENNLRSTGEITQTVEVFDEAGSSQADDQKTTFGEAASGTDGAQSDTGTGGSGDQSDTGAGGSGDQSDTGAGGSGDQSDTGAADGEQQSEAELDSDGIPSGSEMENDEAQAESDDETEAASENLTEGLLNEAVEPSEFQSETDGAEEAQSEMGEILIENDGIILQAEEVETRDYALDGTYALSTETVVGELLPAGLVANARKSGLRSYSASVYVDSYGGQLSQSAKRIYDNMVDAYVTKRGSGSIKITFSTPYNFQTNGTTVGTTVIWNSKNNTAYQQVMAEIAYDLQSAHDAFIYDYPEVFWMETYYYQIEITYSSEQTNPTGTIAGITLAPTELYSGAASEITAFDQEVKSVASAIAASATGGSRAELVEGIHDYLCENLTYEENLYAHSAVGAFLKSRAVVCEGYAKAFKILCRQLGIPSVLIAGDVSGGHMWNYVQMENGSWYLIDATWDDGEEGYGYIDDTYLLAGGSSMGLTRESIATERCGSGVIYTQFSMTDQTQSFAVPTLCSSPYADGMQGHIWYRQAVRTASCTRDASVLYICSIHCQQQKYVLSRHTGHSFTNYVSNNDATVLKDGTKTAKCDNGCGEASTITDTGSRLTPTIKLNATSLKLKKGQSTTKLKVSGLARGDGVKSWKSSKTSVVRVNSSGKITAQQKTGKAAITVTLKSGLKKKISVTVQSGTVKTTKISGVKTSITLKKGKTRQLSPTLTPITSQQKITYSSSNQKVATVSSRGLVTAKKAGTAKITVKSGSKKITMTVKVPSITTKKITGIASSLTLKKGKTKKLKPTLSPAGSTSKVTYKSSKTSVAAVSSSGKITAKKKGMAVITVTSGKAKVTCRVTVK